jgi:hypothetical protein
MCLSTLAVVPWNGFVVRDRIFGSTNTTRPTRASRWKPLASPAPSRRCIDARDFKGATTAPICRHSRLLPFLPSARCGLARHQAMIDRDGCVRPSVLYSDKLPSTIRWCCARDIVVFSNCDRFVGSARPRSARITTAFKPFKRVNRATPHSVLSRGSPRERVVAKTLTLCDGR